MPSKHSASARDLQAPDAELVAAFEASDWTLEDAKAFGRELANASLVYARVTAPPKPKPLQSTKSIIKEAEKATGRPATRVIRSADGKIVVEFDKPAIDDDEARDATVVAFDRIAAMRRAK